jgi:hypothetical protein
MPFLLGLRLGLPLGLGNPNQRGGILLGYFARVSRVRVRVHHSSFINHYSLFINHFSLFIIHYSLFIIYYELFIINIYKPLFIICY